MEEGQQSNQPGFVFKPGGEEAEPAKLPAPEQVTNTPEPTESPLLSEEDQTLPNDSDAHVEWTASEYIANPKNSGWFMLLGLGSIVLAAIVYIVTRDLISTVVTAILGIIVGIFAARQPRTLTYSVDAKGLHIGSKFYPYESFKSFSVADEHAMSYISLQPLRRFMPPLSVHFDPADEDKITQTLASYLPFEDHKPDVVDAISRRVRF